MSLSVAPSHCVQDLMETGTVDDKKRRRRLLKERKEEAIWHRTN
jgi:hypothetical protein